MDENATNTNVEEQQNAASASTAADSAAATEQDTVTPEKANALQKFINGLFGKTEDGNAAETTETEAAESANSTEQKVFTEEDVAAAIESAKQKWADEQAEAERVRKLSPEEKEKEEQQKRDTELEVLRGKLLQRELKESAVAALDQKNFPVKLADNLDYSSKETMEESLKNTMEVFGECLKAAVESRLRGKTPEGLGGAASATNLVKDQIAKNIRGGMM